MNVILSASGCYVDLYQHGQFQGAVDRYSSDTPQVKRNDDSASLKLPRGCCVTLFEEYSYKGSKTSKICESIPQFSNTWINIVSSLQVGKWMSFTHILIAFFVVTLPPVW